MSGTMASRRSLGALPRERLIDRATEAIKDYILANRLEGGARLPSEQELATSLGVSRNIIRQAVSGLETLGVVRVAHGRGIYVADMTDSSIFQQLAQWIDPGDLEDRDFIEVRTIFERGIYELVIAHATDTDFNQLELIAQQLHDAPTEDEVNRLHDQFHQACLAATGNRFLLTLGTILYRFFWSVGYTGPRVHRVTATDLQKSHVEIVKLLRRHQQDLIPAMIALHLKTSEERG
ncbi:MAG: GntR family transcriptional regulator [Chloroflexi bacterium]|nr:GntR family transcriptional regulator [Chloroflexota bacterium]